MAVELFSNTSELQNSVSVNCTFSLDVLGSNMELALSSFILPYVGEDLYEELKDIHINGTPNTEQKTLISRLQKTLGHFALHLHVDEGAINWSDGGIMRRETDTSKSAFKYQENNLRDALLRKGWEWLELSMLYLEKEETSFPLWNSSLKDENRKFFINSSAVFNKHVNLKDGRYHFEKLKPTMDSVEQFSIFPSIGQEFYDEVKEQIRSNNLTPENTRVLPYIQKVVAYFTKSEAIKTNLAQFTADGLVMIQKGTQEGTTWTRNPSSKFADTVVAYNEADANRHLSVLLNFLESNTDDYPTYTAWKTTTINESESDESDSSGCCSCRGACVCNRNDRSEFIMIF